MIPFPSKHYTVIYADPAWSYDDTCDAGERGAAHKYDVMDVNDIASLSVSTIAADDAALFMWMTMPKMEEAWHVVKAWGFTFKTVAFTWLKTTNKGLHWGMGRWTRANPELCWLATRGRPKRVDAGVHSVITAPVTRHSEKPNEARERIVTLMGDVPRIELFARKRYRGWDAWGNQVNDYFEDDVSGTLWQ
jgi:N6-adenosine-specific RNA methylase IME4